MTIDLGGRDTHVEVSEIPTPVSHDGPWDPNVEEMKSPPPTVDLPDPSAAPPAERTSRHRRILPRTLAGRLILGVVSLVLVLVLAMGFATYMLLRPFLYGQLDQQLRPLASNNAAGSLVASTTTQARQPTTCNLTNRFGFHAPQSQWIAVYSPDGKPLVDNLQSSADYVPARLTGRHRASSTISGSEHRSPPTDGADLRVTAPRPRAA